MGTRHLRVLAVVAVLGLGGLAGCAGRSAAPGPAATPTPTTPGASVPATPPTGGTPSAGGLSLPPSKPASAGVDISLRGTVEAGVEHGCLVLRDRGSLYLLLGGDPAVVYAGAAVQVTGHVVKDVMTYCMQGVPFQVTSATKG